jgi:hypothetical protein
MYPIANRQGPHQGAMVFAGVAGLVLIAMFAFCGGNTSPTRAQATPTPKPSVAAASPAPLPKPADLNSAWIGQTPPAQISVGAEATITFRFKNTGTAAWTRGTGSEASLAFVGNDAKFDPRMAVNWPLASRPAVQGEEVVKAGEIATFTFKVKGVAAGTYRIDVRPLVVAVGWLPDQGVYTEVIVR